MTYIRFTLIILFGVFAAVQVEGQQVYQADQTSSLDALLQAALETDIVFLGEQHDDRAGQTFQAEFLQLIHEHTNRPVIVALEMFERDVQPILDEYLAEIIREQDFLAASRPWRDYADAYRPLIEYAREHGLPVVASNVPGRYASLANREGEDALERLSSDVLIWLAPLPVAPPSDSLNYAFRALMGNMEASHGGGGMNLDNILAAQNLRDATMAWSLAEALLECPDALIIHVNGAFHSNNGWGIPEHLLLYRPEIRMLTVRLVNELPETSHDHFIVVNERQEED